MGESRGIIPAGPDSTAVMGDDAMTLQADKVRKPAGKAAAAA